MKTSSAPNDASQILCISKYELLNYVKSRRFAMLFLLTLGACIGATCVVGYFRPSGVLTDPASFYGHWLAYMLVFIVALPAIFLGGDAISSEFQNKTGYSLVGNPIKRSSIFAGKLIAALIASMATLSLFEVVMLANASFYFGSGAFLYSTFWVSFLYATFAVAGAVGLAFFFSSIFKNGAYSILFSAFLLLFGFTLLDNVITRLTNLEPWFMLDYGAQIVENVFRSPYPAHVQTFGAHIFYTASVPEGLVIMAAYFIVGIFVSLIVFQRREFA